MSSLILAAAHIKGPHIDWARAVADWSCSPSARSSCCWSGCAGSAVIRERIVPALALVTLAGAIGTEIWRFPHTETIVAGALRMDDLALS